MSGSIRGKKAYYNRKHKMEQAGLRIRQFKDSSNPKLTRYFISKKKK